MEGTSCRGGVSIVCDEEGAMLPLELDFLCSTSPLVLRDCAFPPRPPACCLYWRLTDSSGFSTSCPQSLGQLSGTIHVMKWNTNILTTKKKERKKEYMVKTGEIWDMAPISVSWLWYCIMVMKPGGHGHPLQYSCLENPKDKGAWWAIVHAVTKSQTQLKWLSAGLWRW